jgi:hypothetical protein
MRRYAFWLLIVAALTANPALSAIEQTKGHFERQVPPAGRGAADGQ